MTRALLSAAVLSLIFSSPLSAAQEQVKKKLYISTIAAKPGVSAALADKVRDLIQITILEKYGSSYKIISSEDVKVMFERAEVLQSAGCNDQNCNVELAQLISADELIYGSVAKEGGKIAVSLTNLAAGKSARDTQVKSMVRLAFDEILVDAYCREIGIKLVDPSYRISAAQLVPSSEFIISNELKERMKSSESLKQITFQSDDTGVSALVGFYMNMAAEGDAFFADGKYGRARSKYREIIVSSAAKLTPETRTKMKPFFQSIDQRISSTFMLETGSAIIDIDRTFENALTEKQLMKVRERYEDLWKKLSADSELDVTTSAAIRKMIFERTDAVTLLVVRKCEKESDDAYYSYRFADALKTLRKAAKLCAGVDDSMERSRSRDSVGAKYKMVLGTGRNYLENRVGSLILQSEYFNVTGREKDSIGVLKKARTEITGSLRYFATAEIIGRYNSAAEIHNAGRTVNVAVIDSEREPKVYKAMNESSAPLFNEQKISSESDSSDISEYADAFGCLSVSVILSVVIGILFM